MRKQPTQSTNQAPAITVGKVRRAFRLRLSDAEEMLKSVGGRYSSSSRAFSHYFKSHVGTAHSQEKIQEMLSSLTQTDFQFGRAELVRLPDGRDISRTCRLLDAYPPGSLVSEAQALSLDSNYGGDQYGSYEFVRWAIID